MKIQRLIGIPVLAGKTWPFLAALEKSPKVIHSIAEIRVCW